MGVEKAQTTRTTSDSPVILLELNELCPAIIDRMMAAGRLPNFKYLHETSETWITHTSDPTLEPWVQWPSFHTGQPQSVHGANNLDEGHLLTTRRIWDELAEAGRDSVIFGSMNGATSRPDKVFLLPDHWSAGVRPTDPTYEIFHRFISRNVIEHTRPDARTGLSETVKFIGFMLSHGLAVGTIADAIAQLADEKTAGMDKTWRRALILDLIMWDVFAHAWKRRRPALATFFANSTAFLQHRYWRHMCPDAYEVRPSDEEIACYGPAIEASYQHMDRLIGKARKLGGPSARFAIATALSQEANTRYEQIGGKYVHRAHSFQDLFNWAGGPQPESFEPVMTHQAWATFEAEAGAREAEVMLGAIQSDGRPVISWRRSGNRILFWCNLISKTDPGLQVTHTWRGERKLFKDIFMLIGQVNNSQHCRDGIFWIQTHDGSACHHPSRLPLESACGVILRRYETPRPCAPSPGLPH